MIAFHNNPHCHSACSLVANTERRDIKCTGWRVDYLDDRILKSSMIEPLKRAAYDEEAHPCRTSGSDPRAAPTMMGRRTYNGNRSQERPMLQEEHLVEKVDNDDSGEPLKRAVYDEKVHVQNGST